MTPTDQHIARARLLQAELDEHGEERVSQWYARPDAVWCRARRADGVRVVAVGYLR